MKKGHQCHKACGGMTYMQFSGKRSASLRPVRSRSDWFNTIRPRRTFPSAARTRSRKLN